jgi:uncharacterized membrane protein
MEREQGSWLDRLRRLDEQRPGLPGEHWLALGAGLWLLKRGPRSTLGRLLSMAAGAALVARAASGRDGLLQRLREKDQQLQRQEPSQEAFVEVAAPWPYEERVRVASVLSH